MRIALAGNPNSGKTTLFNAITGKIEHVGNWPGVTVAKKEGNVNKNLTKNIDEKMRVVDLPGAYSISPFTTEESITRSFVVDEHPDVIINIVDATNLSRSLLFTTQLLEIGIPVVIALNKCDLLDRKGIHLDIEKLSRKLKCPIVRTSSIQSKGLKELLLAASEVSGKKQEPLMIRGKLIGDENGENLEKKRFQYVESLLEEVEQRKVESRKQNNSDSIDRIIAHKYWGIPIFAFIMYAVFSLSQSTLGPMLADVLVGWMDGIYAMVDGLIGNSVSPLLRTLLLDGIIG